MENKTMDTETGVEERAALMADVDRNSVKNEDPTKVQIPYVVKLSRAYDKGNGEKIDTIDLSGMENLTTMDAQEVDQIVSKLGYVPRNKWRDTLYTKHVAVKATGLTVEFFNALAWKDMEDITSMVAVYFLLS